MLPIKASKILKIYWLTRNLSIAETKWSRNSKKMGYSTFSMSVITFPTTILISFTMVGKVSASVTMIFNVSAHALEITSNLPSFSSTESNRN